MESYAKGRDQRVKRKLGRLLRPGMGAYFFVMAAFCAAALAERHYWLSAAEASVTQLVFVMYLVGRKRRDNQIGKYVKSMANTMESSSQGDSPLPADPSPAR